MLYQKLIRRVLFRLDPEEVHNRALRTGSLLGRLKISKSLLKKFFVYENKKLEQNILGIDFKNPVGLGAGFDKNGVLVDVLPSIGFGFMEAGSVTLKPCAGNPKPRLFRLPEEKSIIVNYGLCNEGAERVGDRLRGRELGIPLGVNVARTNQPMKEEEAIDDFAAGFGKLKGRGDYLTVNLSCPNTFDGIDFCDAVILERLLGRIEEKNKEIARPVFLKLKPDLGFGEIDKIIEVAERFGFVKGFVIGNLTKNREGLRTAKEKIDGISLKGGLSGLPAKEKSDKLIKYVYGRTKGKYVVVGCGGIFSAQDAYEKIKLGASLVQLVTGLVYEGPGLVKEINGGMVRLLERDGYGSVGEAVGKGIR